MTKTQSLTCVAAAFLLSACATTNPPPEQSPPKPTQNINLRLGQIALDNRDPTTAESIFRKAAERAPEDPRPLIGLGKTAMLANAPEAAEDVFEKAAILNPKSYDALSGLGKARFALGKYAQAKDAFEKAIALRASRDSASSVSSPSDYIGLGISLDVLGQHADAQKAFRQGLIAHPKAAALSNNLAFSLALEENYSAAIAVLDPIAKTATATEQTRLNLALVYGLMGKTQAAQKQLEQVLPAEAVVKNLKYYEELRKLPTDQRRKMILDVGTD